MEHNNRGSVEHVIRKFPNGDTYTGGWSGGLPDGEGKYTWADKSQYVGGWKRGLKHGVGRYRWPSGATYQGEWFDGMMQGVGTFEAVDGTMYAGSWYRNRKHGLGKKVYANQDCYEGLWKQGKAWGPGRYMWVDGNEYDGEWSAGVMHGQGTFVWRTGERYDGEWKNGLEDGQGIFTWADGSVFDGFWSKGRKHGVGLYWPVLNRANSSFAPNPDIDPQAREQPEGPVGSTPGHSSPQSPAGTRPGSPTTTAQVLEDNDSPVRAPAVSTRRSNLVPHHQPSGQLEAMYVREYDRGRMVRNTSIVGNAVKELLVSLVGENQALRDRKLFAGKNDKVGEIIKQGHRSYELMLDLQLGVRWSVSKITPTAIPKSGLLPSHFRDKVKVSFPHVGSRETPPHPQADFRWKDYCPLVFRKLRTSFVVDPGEYMLSICGEQALRELSSPGKSGALFYISHDDRFLIKTMRPNEMKTFLRMLPEYYEHVQSNPHTLLTKFYGLYRIKLAHGTGKSSRKIRFVVMGNIFNAEVPIHQRYDLKGSTQGRFTKDKSKSSIWKDLDLDVELRLAPEWKERLDRQLHADAMFLQMSKVMDYSLLMGIHYKGREQAEAEGGGDGGDNDQTKLLAELQTAKKKYMQKIVSWNLPEARAKDVVLLVHSQLRRKQKRLMRYTNLRKKDQGGGGEKGDQGAELAFQLGEKRMQLGLGMSAGAVNKDTGQQEEVVVYFGIIDFLQEYNGMKKAEHALKAVRYDGSAVSVVNPVLYAQRFTKFMRNSVFC